MCGALFLQVSTNSGGSTNQSGYVVADVTVRIDVNARHVPLEGPNQLLSQNNCTEEVQVLHDMIRAPHILLPDMSTSLRCFFVAAQSLNVPWFTTPVER